MSGTRLGVFIENGFVLIMLSIRLRIFLQHHLSFSRPTYNIDVNLIIYFKS